MIVDRPQSHFIFLFSRDTLNSDDLGAYMVYQGKRLTNREYFEHWGKWVYLDERENLDELARKLDSYVESGEISCIKYDHAPLRTLGMDQCVLCVYCDDRRKGEVWEILSRFGIKGKAWVYEKEVMEMWMPGGALLEKWITAQGLTGERAEKIRENVRHAFSVKYGSPDDLATGWEQ